MSARRQPAGKAGIRARTLRGALLGAALALALGVCSALLVSCGSSGTLIPEANAGPLKSDFEAVARAAGEGSCETTEAAVLKTEQDFAALPSSLDAGLRERLSEGISNLRKRALSSCAAATTATSATTTAATTPKTTTSTTTPATTATETTTTSTSTTPTTTAPATTPAETPPPTTTPGPGGGTQAPHEEAPGAQGGGDSGAGNSGDDLHPFLGHAFARGRARGHRGER